jgi:hypothetical protein
VHVPAFEFWGSRQIAQRREIRAAHFGHEEGGARPLLGAQRGVHLGRIARGEPPREFLADATPDAPPGLAGILSHDDEAKNYVGRVHEPLACSHRDGAAARVFLAPRA